MPVRGPRCSGCAFEQSGTIFIPPDGSGLNGVMFVGDSGWHYEASALRHTPEAVGTPFSGPSGWWMERQFKRMNLSRDDFSIANAIWCKAPRLGMTDAPHKYPAAASAISHCSPYLDAFIAERQPRVFVPMGGAALHRLTGIREISKFHAYTLPTRYGIPAIPAFHPSFILQGNQKLTPAWHYVVRKALAIAQGVAPSERQYDLLLDPPVDAAAAYLTIDTEYLVCDIETRDSVELGEDERHDSNWQIVRISFSNKAGTAISFPWDGRYKAVAINAIAKAPTIIFWNQAFDAPRLRAEGCTINGTIVDAMWAWHFLQSDLPKALGFAAPLLVNVKPWKHLSGSQPAYYSALDSAITMDCWLATAKQLLEEGRYSAFHNQCTNILPHLRTMTDAGMLIDRSAQAALIDGKLTTERDALFVKIQTQVPQSVRPIKLYKLQAPKKIDTGEYWIPNANGKGGRLLRAFNPASSNQRKELFRALGLSVPFDKRKDAETVQTKHMRKYRKKYPVFADIIAYTERAKLIDAYNWPVAADGRVHPEFAFNPTTWRKNARNPNIQTIPKRNELASAFRRLFIASPGQLLIECDSSAIEAVLVGYFAGSDLYMQLAKAGVHKYVAQEFAKRPVSKDEPLYDQIKRIVHLSNYMGTARRIAEEYPDDFPTVASAQKLQDFYFGLPAGQDVRRWQKDTLARADFEHYLETPFGQRHYFYDVLTKRDGTVSLGTDAKRAVAFMPQASASAIQSHYILTLPPEARQFLRAIIHDSIVMEAPEAIAHDVAHTLYETMTQPIPQLGGLSIGAECKIGPNLGEMTPLEVK